jgi:branched-subunit amino acid ABC-type transport system permease component
VTFDQILLQQVIGGLAIGVIYGLVALGFTMIIRAMDLVNFAQGEMMMIGAMVGFTMVAPLSLPYAVALLLSIPVTAALGVVMERVAYRPLRHRRAPMVNLVISTIGMAIFLENLAIPIWGSEPLRYPPVYGTHPLMLGGVIVPAHVPPVLAAGLMLMLVLNLFLQRTRTGIAMRAAAQDPTMARLMGISVDRMISYTFGVASGLGGAAGVLLAPIYFATFNMGEIGIKSFVAATIGGLGNLSGAILGGVILGLLETLGAALVSPAYKDAIAYGILIAMLLFLPQGILGNRSGRRDR